MLWRSFPFRGFGTLPNKQFSTDAPQRRGRKYGKGYSFPMLAKNVFPHFLQCRNAHFLPKQGKRKTPQSATLQSIPIKTKTRELYSPVVSSLASSMPLAVADTIFKSFSLMPSSMVSSWRRRVDFSCSVPGKRTGLPIHQARLQAHTKSVNLGAARCSQWTQYSAAQCSTCPLTDCAIFPLLFLLLNGLPESLKIKLFFTLLHSHFTQLHFTVHLFFGIWLHIA